MKKNKNGKKEEKKFNSFDKIDNSEMDELLYELSKTSYWQAILKYNRLRDTEMISVLISTDAFKFPTAIARAQGTRIGIYYLEQKIEQIIRKKEKKEEEKAGTFVHQGY